jgi:hypothetical protein
MLHEAYVLLSTCDVTVLGTNEGISDMQGKGGGGGKSETSLVQTNLSTMCRMKGEHLAKFVRSRHGNKIGSISST